MESDLACGRALFQQAAAGGRLHGLRHFDGERALRSGARWQVAPGVAVSLEVTRKEAREGAAEHGLMLRGSLGW